MAPEFLSQSKRGSPSAQLLSMWIVNTDTPMLETFFTEKKPRLRMSMHLCILKCKAT